MNVFFYGLAQALIILLSISIHEAAHAWMADRMGDPTAKYLGRVTLNPIKHIDLWGTIIIPLFLILIHSPFIFGWAKPVPINPNNFYDRKKGEILTSIAGPLSNFLLAVAAGLLLRFTLKSHNVVLINFLGILFILNMFLAFFNLIPIPPLDGSHILENMLSYRARIVYERWAPYSFIIILLLWNILNPLFVLFINLFSQIIIGGKIL